MSNRWPCLALCLLAACSKLPIAPKQAAPPQKPLTSVVPPQEPNVTLQGSPGGPFVPESFTFRVLNQTEQSMKWELVQKPPWLTVTPSAGYLRPGADIHPVATPSPEAGRLTPGDYARILQVRFRPLVGDFNGDLRVNAADAAIFLPCVAGPSIHPRDGCEWMDRDKDGDVDQSDFGLWQRCYSGAKVARTECEGQ